jgi:hypothetical protein
MSNYVIKTGSEGELTPAEQDAIDSIVNSPDGNILVTEGGVVVDEGLRESPACVDIDGRKLGFNADAKLGYGSSDNLSLSSETQNILKRLLTQDYDLGNTAKTTIFNELALETIGVKTETIPDPSWNLSAYTENLTITTFKFDFVSSPAQLLMTILVNGDLLQVQDFGTVGTGEQLLTLNSPIDFTIGDTVNINLSDNDLSPVEVQGTGALPWYEIQRQEKQPTLLATNAEIPNNYAPINSGDNAFVVQIYDLAINDNYLYVVGRDTSSVSIFDITDPAKPLPTNTLTSPLQNVTITAYQPDGTDFGASTNVYATELAPQGTQITITGSDEPSYNGTFDVIRDRNYMSIDVPYAGQPLNSGTYSITEMSEIVSIEIMANTLYVSSNVQSYVYAFDLKDPNNPVLVGGLFDSRFLNSQRMTADTDRLYIPTNNSSITVAIVDAKDPTRLSIIGLEGSIEVYGKCAVRNNIVYFFDRNIRQLNIVDVSDEYLPAGLTLGTLLDNDFTRCTDCILRGSYLYTLQRGTIDFLFVIDVSDPSAPVVTDSFNIPFNFSDGFLTLLNDYLLVSLTGGGTGQFLVFDITEYNDVKLVYQLDNINVAQYLVHRSHICSLISGIDEVVFIDNKTIEMAQARIGNVHADSMTVTQNFRSERFSDFSGGASVGGDLNVKGNLSTGGRGVYGTPLDVQYIDDVSQLPAPVGGFIHLKQNTRYVFVNNYPESGRRRFIINDPFKFPDEGSNEIVGNVFGSTVIVYTGVGAIYNTDPTFFGAVTTYNTFLSAPNGSIFNVEGTNPPLLSFFPRFSFVYFAFYLFTSLGTFKNIHLNMSIGGIFGGTGGLTGGLFLEDLQELVLENVRFSNWDEVPNSIMLNYSGDIRLSHFSNNQIEQSSNYTLFNISPLIGANNQLLINSNLSFGGVKAFAELEQGIIQQSVDESDSFAVTGALDIGGVALFQAVQTLVPDQPITLTGFSEPTYNGDFFVIASDGANFDVKDANDVPLAYVVSDTGSGDAPSIRFNTLDTGSLINGDVINIYGTSEYDGGYTIFNVITDTSFDVYYGGVIVASQTELSAYWQSGSITQTDPRITSTSNNKIRNSKSIGALFVNNNLVQTDIDNQDTYQPITLSGILPASNIERFSIEPDPDDEGILKFQGDNFSGEVIAEISAFKAGSIETYEFSIAKNGVLPVGNEPYSPLQIKTAIDNTALTFPIELVKGDIFQVVVLARGNNSSLTINNMQIFTQG